SRNGSSSPCVSVSPPRKSPRTQRYGGRFPVRRPSSSTVGSEDLHPSIEREAILGAVAANRFPVAEAPGGNPARRDSGLDQRLANRGHALSAQRRIVVVGLCVIGVTIERDRDLGIRLHPGGKLVELVGAPRLDGRL